MFSARSFSGRQAEDPTTQKPSVRRAFSSTIWLTMSKIIYAPSAQLSLSNGIGSRIYVDLVVNSINVSGGANFQSYASLAGTTSPLAAD